jgi:hypothetical protein
MNSNTAFSKLLLTLLLTVATVNALVLRMPSALTTGTPILPSNSMSTETPLPMRATHHTRGSTITIFETAFVTPSTAAVPSTSIVSVFVSDDALPTSTALNTLTTTSSPASPTSYGSSLTCGSTATIILQAISDNSNVTGQYLYFTSLESGDTLSLTSSSSTATRLTISSTQSLATLGRSQPLFATSAKDNEFGPVYMDSQADIDSSYYAEHDKLVVKLNSDDAVSINNGGPAVLQVDPVAAGIGYATVMVQSYVEWGYAGMQMHAICLDEGR